MATDPKAERANALPSPIEGVRIFTYPKIIFIYPSMIAALICGLGMAIIGNDTTGPAEAAGPPPVDSHARAPATDPQAPAPPATKAEATVSERPAAVEVEPDPAIDLPRPLRRFGSIQNLLALGFLGVFAFNVIVMALDFPRFTLVAGLFLVAAITFFLLWLGVFFDLLTPLLKFLEGIYAVANAEFYFLFATILIVVFGLIMVTRWLDYWEIRPNEILHHHGPWSDLERFPTFNLKFDKEIPDIMEFIMLGSGRLVLHVAGHHRAIVLDNVLRINKKETKLKRLMGQFAVRVAPDREVGEPR